MYLLIPSCSLATAANGARIGKAGSKAARLTLHLGGCGGIPPRKSGNLGVGFPLFRRGRLWVIRHSQPIIACAVHIYKLNFYVASQSRPVSINPDFSRYALAYFIGFAM